MEWYDQGIIIATRPHGETSVVCDLFTKHHGRHAGLVRGGRSKRLRPVCQIGNVVDASWRARLDEHLGTFALELDSAIASRYFDEPMTLAALSTLCGHLTLFAERDPHPTLYEGARTLLSHLDNREIWPSLLVRYEVEVLAELGVGLDLSECAATGQTSDLIYVSPKSGRAVSRSAGAPYKDKLLKLPPFLIGQTQNISHTDLQDGFDLTGSFFEKHSWFRQNQNDTKSSTQKTRYQFLKYFHRLALDE